MNEFLNKVFSYDIIIAPTLVQRSLIRARSRFPRAHTQFFSLNDLRDDCFFSINERLELALCQQANINLETSRIYLNNMYFFQQPKKLTSRLDLLTNWYKTLKEQNLILPKNTLHWLFLNKSVGIFGYTTDNPELQCLLTELAVEADFLLPNSIKLENDLWRYHDMEAEVSAFFEKCATLIENGTPISQIVLLNPPADYVPLLERYSHFYHLPLELNRQSPLSSFPWAQAFLHNGKLPNNVDASDPIIRAINKILVAYPDQSLEFYQEVFQQFSVGFPHLKEAIQTVQYFPLDNQKEVFILGFAEGNYPAVSRDLDFLSPTEKELIGRQSATSRNHEARERLLSGLSIQSNLHLSFAAMVNGQEAYPSPLIDPSQIKEEEWHGHLHSRIRSELRLATLQDLARKYNFSSSELLTYQQKLKIPYQDYRNQFSGIDRNFLTQDFRHSYSAIKIFYQCPFHYYLERIIGLRDEEDRFGAKYGRLAHELLKKMYGDNFDFEQEFIAGIARENFTSAEKLLLPRLHDELLITQQFIRAHERNMQLKSTQCEVPFTKQIKAHETLFGIIDKIYYTGDNGQYVALIDYKTGSERFNPDVVKDGASLQLPIYAYLLADQVEMRNREIIGLYIHPLLATDNIENKVDQNQNYFFSQQRLVGATIDEIKKVKTLDVNYTKSNFIAGLNYSESKESFYKNATVYPAELFQKIASLAGDLIEAADTRIRQADFAITPLRVNSDDACTFCPFRDICFRKESDYHIVSSKGGNENE